MKKLIITSILLSLLFSVSAQASAESLKAKDAKVMSRYKATRAQYTKEVDFYKSARQDYLAAKNKFRKTRSKEDRKVSEERAKQFITHAIQSLVKRLETIKGWVENRSTLSEADKKNIIAEIDQDITWLEEKLALVNDMTVREIKQLAKDLRNYWKNHRVKVKRITGLISANRFNHLIEKAENFGTRVESKIEELEEEGEDVAQLSEWLIEYNNLVSEAEEKWVAAKEMYSQISSLNDADQIARQAHALIKEAHQKIKEAHQKLSQIIRAIKGMGQNS